jgi:hypothetical protein
MAKDLDQFVMSLGAKAAKVNTINLKRTKHQTRKGIARIECSGRK